jgi:hypothetical protein
MSKWCVAGLMTVMALVVVLPALAQPDKNISVDFRDTPLADAISVLQKISGANIVLEPGVEGTVTASLKVTWSWLIRSPVLPPLLTKAGTVPVTLGGVVCRLEARNSMAPTSTIPGRRAPFWAACRTRPPGTS